MKKQKKKHSEDYFELDQWFYVIRLSGKGYSHPNYGYVSIRIDDLEDGDANYEYISTGDFNHAILSSTASNALKEAENWKKLGYTVELLQFKSYRI